MKAEHVRAVNAEAQTGSKTVLRIGHMPYLNSVVFYHSLRSEDLEFSSLPPRNMADAMRRGEVDAGPLPISEVLRMGDMVIPVSDLGVAVYGPATSVILISKLPVQDLKGETVSVSAQTSTSVQLLRILFDRLWDVDGVNLAEPSEDGAARLLIGDDALRHIYSTESVSEQFSNVYDLSSEWKRLTGLPFVFARWVARSDVDSESAAKLEEALAASYKEGVSRIELIASSQRIPGMSQTDAERYISNFIYRLGARELEAIEIFEEMLGELPIWHPPVFPWRSGTSIDSATKND